MTEREALNMALHALETLMIERGSIYDKATTAIREALADPSPNFNCKSVQARLATAWGYVKAPPEQEPVAWYRDEDGIRIYYETKCWDDATPLYTAPQPWEKFCDSNCVWTDHHPDCKLAEQEPVAWRHKQFFETQEGWFYADWHSDGINPPSAELLYTTPPQRTWVGLTLDERIELAQDVDWPAGAYCEYAEKIEAKLKEKNT